MKLEQNYRSTQTILDATNAIIANNRGAEAEAAVDRGGRGEPIDDRRARGRARGGALRRREIERLATRRASRGRDRGLLPHQRPEPRARGHAGPLRRPLPGDRGDEVLRARRDQGRDRLPDPARQPRRRVSFARVVNSPRRGIGQTTQGRLLSHANTTGRTASGRWQHPERSPGSARPRQGRRPVRRDDDGLRAAGRPPRPSPSCSRPLSGAATSRRSRPSARSRPRAGSTTSVSWSGSRASSTPTARSRRARPRAEIAPLDEFLQQISPFTDQDAMRDRRSSVTLMTLHNAKGLEFDGRVHDRVRGRGVPPLALDRGGKPRGGAPPLLRRRHASETPLWLSFARQRSLYGARGYNLPSRFLSEIPDELVEREGAAGGDGLGRGDQARRLGLARAPSRVRRSSSRSATTSSTRASARGW